VNKGTHISLSVKKLHRKETVMTNRLNLILLGLVFVFIVASSAIASEIKVYKSPYCGCCENWSEQMEKDGFSIVTEKISDMETFKNKLEIPVDLRSCHTAVVDGYVLEGHVPASEIKRLLKERPDIKGLAVPGMPIGSPGMEMGGRRDSFNVLGIQKDGSTFIYKSYSE
jgi:hypothetical protein